MIAGSKCVRREDFLPFMFIVMNSKRIQSFLISLVSFYFFLRAAHIQICFSEPKHYHNYVGYILLIFFSVDIHIRKHEQSFFYRSLGSDSIVVYGEIK